MCRGTLVVLVVSVTAQSPACMHVCMHAFRSQGAEANMVDVDRTDLSQRAMLCRALTGSQAPSVLLPRKQVQQPLQVITIPAPNSPQPVDVARAMSTDRRLYRLPGSVAPEGLPWLARPSAFPKQDLLPRRTKSPPPLCLQLQRQARQTRRALVVRAGGQVSTNDFKVWRELCVASAPFVIDSIT